MGAGTRHPVWSFLDLPLTLVSRSPRRREILRRVGVPFEVDTSVEVSEKVRPDEPARRFLVRVAGDKAMSALRAKEKRIVVGADTIVLLDGAILGKPVDRAAAEGMLRRLSARTHIVMTGLSVIHEGTGRRVSGVEETRVTFRRLTEAEIDGYVGTGEPFDKAGGYGIQEMGGLFVERIEGCYFNVVGLPVTRLGELLREVSRPTGGTIGAEGV